MRVFVKLILVIAVCGIDTALFAQVTIGMGEKPAKAALLQLKDQASDASNVTSKTGGLLLPRVKLVNLKTLEPFMSPTVTNYAEEKKLSTGLLVYNVNEQTADKIYPGVYCWNGEEWKISSATTAVPSSNDGTSGSGAVKINVNQSKCIALSGTQSYGLLMVNQQNTITPHYVTGTYPSGGTSGSPTSIITSSSGNDGALLFEAPSVGKANFYRLNMQYVMGNNPPSETKYFNVSVVSVATGEIIYQNSIVVPGKMNTGHVAYFQVFFPTIADATSISKGYRLMFGIDGAASTGLQGNISVKVVDIARINQ